MLISLIAALDENRGIGKDNAIPWRLSADLKRFKALTMGHHLIMGRKTYESIGRPLPGRTTIILSRNRKLSVAGCLVVHSLESAFEIAMERGETEVFVIGGGEIFQEALPIADRIYLTVVHTQQNCDVFFPELDLSEWEVLEKSDVPADLDNQYTSSFSVLYRIQPTAAPE